MDILVTVCSTRYKGGRQRSGEKVQIKEKKKEVFAARKFDFAGSTER